jgi:alpha-aminoadipate carrier protein LysW
VQWGRRCAAARDEKEITMTPECPECAAQIKVGDVVKGEILRCVECGADLEVTSLNPLTVELAPSEEEDWGE